MNYPSIRIEGAILSPDILDRLEDAILQEAEITIRDVVIYYARDAKDINSGCRTLARINGDWRPIDQLAQECLIH